MGIVLQELLSLEYFKDFQVVAGRKGLHKEIQGVTVMDAPDSFHWTRGKELILSSGYVLSREPDCIYKAFQDGNMQKTSCVMIKRERYIDVEQFPGKLLALFDKYEVPLITMPFSVPWMEVMSQINTAVLNRTIRRFRITSSSVFQLSNLSYKEQKIKRILQAVEAEMEFPAFLYDIVEKQSYYSSVNFRRIMDSLELNEEELWNPSKPFTKHTLCDYIQMVRYRLIEQQDENGSRVSWITIPLTMNGQNQAYFVVMESRELLDYYDESSIRIAYIMLQSIYEQIMAALAAGNIGFENFVHFALNSDNSDKETLVHQATVQGIPLSEYYVFVVFRQRNHTLSVRGERKQFMEVFQKCFSSRDNRMAFLDENEGVIFLDEEVWKGKEREEELKHSLLKLKRLLQERVPGFKMEFGTLQTPVQMKDMRSAIEKCQKVLNIGRILCPQENVWSYERLGPLAWIQIPEKELKEMLRTYEIFCQDEKNIELLRTLKIYLENNMNFSVTAEKMYVHINTIRKRIEKIQDMTNMDFSDYLSRLKTELLLQFMHL